MTFSLQVDDVAALQSLESVMVEFFSPGTSNERKREIDQNLQEFARRIDSWRPCLHFLSSSSNNYVSMFALTTLEVGPQNFHFFKKNFASFYIDQIVKIFLCRFFMYI